MGLPLITPKASHLSRAPPGTRRRSGPVRDGCALGRVTLAGVLGLDCFEKPFGAVRGESTMGPVPDEQHVVPGEPELAVGVLGQRYGPRPGTGRQ